MHLLRQLLGGSLALEAQRIAVFFDAGCAVAVPR
jgi:hypothetical protein